MRLRPYIQLQNISCSSTNNRNILEETDDKFTFPPGSLLPGRDNVITVVQVNSTYPLSLFCLIFIYRTIWASTRLREVGLDPKRDVTHFLTWSSLIANTDSSKGPRGIRGFALDGNTFGDWKVQGKVGGYKK